VPQHERVGVFVDGAAGRFEKNIEDVLFSAQLNVTSSAQFGRAGVQARRLKAVDRWFAML
jgi:hypothetical protein